MHIPIGGGHKWRPAATVAPGWVYPPPRDPSKPGPAVTGACCGWRMGVLWRRSGGKSRRQVGHRGDRADQQHAGPSGLSMRYTGRLPGRCKLGACGVRRARQEMRLPQQALMRRYECMLRSSRHHKLIHYILDREVPMVYRGAGGSVRRGEEADAQGSERRKDLAVHAPTLGIG